MKQALILFLFLQIFPLLLFAQKIKKKTLFQGNRKEVYFFDKKTKMRHGPSVMIHMETGDTLITGTYYNGMRAGNWSFFSPQTGIKQLEYNFSENELISVSKEMLADSFLIVLNNKEEVRSVDQPLLFIGYKNQLRDEIVPQLKIPMEIMKNGETGTSILRFNFNENGNISGSNVIYSFNTEIEQKISTLMNSFSDRFIPAVYNGNPIASSLYFKLSLLNEKPPSSPNTSKPYLLEIDIIYKSFTRIENKVIRSSSSPMPMGRNSRF